jgi:hypothetical protein
MARPRKTSSLPPDAAPTDSDIKKERDLAGKVFGIWTNLILALPKLKTGIQLVGFLVLVAGFISYQQVPQDRVPGVIAAGAIGVLFLIFGQIFRLAERSEPLQDPRFISTIFLIFCLFIIILFGVASFFLLPPARLPPPKAGLEIVGLKLDSSGGDCGTRSEVLVSLRNTGTETHVIKTASLSILEKWRLRPIHIHECDGDMMKPSAVYPIPICDTSTPCVSSIDITHFVEPNGVDQIGLLPEESSRTKKPIDGEFVYRAKVILRFDADNKEIHSEEFIFMNHGNDWWIVYYDVPYKIERVDTAAHAENLKVVATVNKLPLKKSQEVLRMFQIIEKAKIGERKTEVN